MINVVRTNGAPAAGAGSPGHRAPGTGGVRIPTRHAFGKILLGMPVIRSGGAGVRNMRADELS